MRTLDSGLQGWLAQTAPNGTTLIVKVGEVEPPGTFEPGDIAVTLTTVRFRRSPGYANKPPSDVIADVPAGTQMTIVSGPQPADQLPWWQVDLTGQRGWMAETAPNGAALLDPAPEPPAGAFRPGDQAVTLDVVRVRRSPGYVDKPADDVLLDAPSGTRVSILAGPQSADDLTWWEAGFTDARQGLVQGWMAETAPNGVQLLAPAEGVPPEPPKPVGKFDIGELIQAATQVRVRRTPGTVNKPGNDVLGEFAPKATLNVIAGPRPVDGLTWWQVGGILSGNGEAIGWTAEAASNGVVLLQRAASLPGTSIPDPATDQYLDAPFDGKFDIGQLWGENPEFYKKFTYDGVPLKGHNGIDFLTPTGTTVRATAGGRVKSVGFEADGFGNYVVLAHPWGESIYAHLDSVSVGETMAVQPGMPLGLSGNSGGSQGPHLHFAIRIAPFNRADGWGGFSDPLPYLDPASFRLPAYVLPPDALRATLSAAPALRGASLPSSPRMRPQP
ncbi:MAG: M23 family metallopeptidase [Caldilineaceae bacterium]|nr:M23 family metallopeptidase [Caldilineaceae bacterium]